MPIDVTDLGSQEGLTCDHTVMIDVTDLGSQENLTCDHTVMI